MHASIPSSAIILDTVVKATLLLAIAWGATLILKKRSAATQHVVRTFALAALLLLPFSVMLLPAWHIKGLPQYPKSRLTQPAATRQAATATLPVNTSRASAAPVKRKTVSASAVATSPQIETETGLLRNGSPQTAPSAIASTAVIGNATIPTTTL